MSRTMLYHYFRKFDGNVCTDWRLTHDLTTSLETTDGKAERVNSRAFEQFLNPDFKGSEPGSCQGAGALTSRVYPCPNLFQTPVPTCSSPPHRACPFVTTCHTIAGYEDKQLKFSVYVKPAATAAAASSVQPIL